MRRYVFLILIAIVLGVPFVLRGMVGPHGETAARASGDLTLVIVVPHDQSIRREFSRAFDTWHRRHYGTAVTIDFRTPGGTNDIQRLLETTYRPFRDAKGKLPDNVPADIDVAWGGGDNFFEQLKSQGILQPMHLDPAALKAAFPDPLLGGARLYEGTKAADGTPTPQWVGICLSTFGIMYNPDVYDSLGIAQPRGWNDLTDPRLAGMIALADPSHSASAAVAYMMVLQRAMADSEGVVFTQRPNLRSMAPAARQRDPVYQAAIADGWHRGMRELIRIAANARYFTDSSSQVPNDVANGQTAAGVVIDFYARVTAQIVGPQRAQFLLPPAATAINPDPVALLRGVKGAKKELAEQFVEFLISAEAQRIWILKAGEPGGPVQQSLFRMPIRRDVYSDRSGWCYDADPFDASGGFNQRGEWMTLFSDIRPIWVAAWINSRDALEDAYGRILKVSDPTRRERLLDNLADLPITMAEVQALHDNLKKNAQISSFDSDAWRARQQIEWTTTFSDHYRKVAAEACE